MEQIHRYKEYANKLLKEFPMLKGHSYIAPFLVLEEHSEITINQVAIIIYGRMNNTKARNISGAYKAIMSLIEKGFIDRTKKKLTLTDKGKLFIQSLKRWG